VKVALTGIIAGLLLGFLFTYARAAEVKLPPGITCEMIRQAVTTHGRILAYTWALANGYTPKEIREAKRCLKATNAASG